MALERIESLDDCKFLTFLLHESGLILSLHKLILLDLSNKYFRPPNLRNRDLSYNLQPHGCLR